MSLRVLSSLLVLSGCAAVEAPRIVGTNPTVVWDDRDVGQTQAREPMSLDEARSIAFAHDAAHTCELTARALRAKDKQRGWAVMEQCISRPDFNDLELLLSPPWIEEVKRHPDFGALVAHVIAVRGGDVTYDLRLCRRAKLPLFSLKAAVNEPESRNALLDDLSTRFGRLLLAWPNTETEQHRPQKNIQDVPRPADGSHCHQPKHP